MKKLVLSGIVALILIVSGLTAVGAYEGHMVDVKAHVENALMVEKDQVDFGNAFPEEKIETQFKIGLSQSFRDQKRYSSVDYSMYWEPKSTVGYTVGIDDPANEGYFIPIWPYIAVQSDGVDFPISGYVDKGEGLWLIGSASMNMTDTCDDIHFSFNPPVFDKWYNKLTDPKIPSGILGPTYYYTTVETSACTFTATVPHTDLGSNFKIQVTDIYGD
jgi:hypothetical protein